MMILDDAWRQTNSNGGEVNQPKYLVVLVLVLVLVQVSDGAIRYRSSDVSLYSFSLTHTHTLTHSHQARIRYPKVPITIIGYQPSSSAHGRVG